MIENATKSDVSAASGGMVERVEDAILRAEVEVAPGEMRSLRYFAGLGIDHFPTHSANFDAICDGLFKAAARAALLAMREPSDEMIAAVTVMPSRWELIEQGQVYDEYDSDPATLSDEAPTLIWQAMIDTALQEGE